MNANRHTWVHLNPIQLGKYAEYLVKMEFVLHGCEIFSSEVDDHGIDFVMRTRGGKHYDVQVKSDRVRATIYLNQVHPSLFLALVRFIEGEPPTMFLIPTCLAEGTNQLFRKGYTDGRKVETEWGLSLSKNNLAALARDYSFQAVAARLI